MNETDFIRQQLTVERAHLREILQAVRHSGGARAARPVALYIDWAGRRLLNQLAAHRSGLHSAALDAGSAAQLATVATRAADTDRSRAPHLQIEPLLAVVEAWSESLDALAGRTLRVTHWREAAQLSADSILEERQLFAAARACLAPG
jgi:hypothetical protein